MNIIIFNASNYLLYFHFMYQIVNFWAAVILYTNGVTGHLIYELRKGYGYYPRKGSRTVVNLCPVFVQWHVVTLHYRINHMRLLYYCEESTKISSTTFSRVVAATPTFSWVDIFVMVGRCCHIFGNIFIS